MLNPVKQFDLWYLHRVTSSFNSVLGIDFLTGYNN